MMNKELYQPNDSQQVKAPGYAGEIGFGDFA